ncbi:MAG: alpha-2-macroglobulin, partial [Chloroflexia bacterium]|nr:alpha-2-macroglobulin [Chloroflexia bacterium]
VGTTQVVTFTPSSGWAYGTRYAVQLGESPSDQRGFAEIWRFQVEPQPRLVAFFPGQGQILPPEEAIRLIFSTPMDATSLEANVRFEPPVADVALTTSSSEVLLRPELEPSTLYTLTVAADARDRNGEPLGTDAVVSLRTAPAPPSLTIPDAFADLVSLEPSTPATLDLAMRNLSGVNVSLYPLDQPALLRFMALRPEERAGFVPERYGQTPSRIWRAPGTTGADQLVRQSLPIGLVDGEPLDPGAYYVRLVAPEGPRADLVVLVNTTRLLVQHYPDQVLIWASDRAGMPRGDLPVALFRNERLVARGRTDANGIWIASGLTESTGSLLALTEDGEPAVVQSDWRLVTPDATRPSFNALLFPDQPIYRPGETITVTGFARQQSGGLLANPPTCRLQLRQPIGNPVGLATSCQFEPATGLVSGTLVLASRTVPGPYRLAATLGDAQILMPVRVVSPGAPSFELNAT